MVIFFKYHDFTNYIIIFYKKTGYSNGGGASRPSSSYGAPSQGSFASHSSHSSNGHGGSSSFASHSSHSSNGHGGGSSGYPSSSGGRAPSQSYGVPETIPQKYDSNGGYSY